MYLSSENEFILDAYKSMVCAIGCALLSLGAYIMLRAVQQICILKGEQMRDAIAETLKEAQKAKQKHRVSTLRLIMAAIGDRDIALRGKGKDKADNEEVLDILTKMVKQRLDSSKMYREGGRPELEAQELEEIGIIREFLPKQLSVDESLAAIKSAIEDTGAASLRDMGKVMGVLKEKYRGQLDMGKASTAIKSALGG